MALKKVDKKFANRGIDLPAITVPTNLKLSFLLSTKNALRLIDTEAIIKVYRSFLIVFVIITQPAAERTNSLVELLL